jgi:hypothetical protein
MKLCILCASTAVVAALLGAPTAGAAEFPAVVRAILNSQTDGRLASMGTSQRARMTDCVVAALSGVPNGRKRFVVEGKDLDEQEHRFGQVVLENQAQWKKAIARACASIAMGQEERKNK